MIPMNGNGTINFDRVFNLYRGSEARPVHNQKQYDAAVSEGFGAYVPQEYPHTLYKEDGSNRVVKSKDEESAAEVDGFRRGRAHVNAAPKQEVMAPLPAVPHNDWSGAIQALEKRSDAQAETITAIQSDMAAIKGMLESLTAPAPKEKAPKEKAPKEKAKE